jgi:drug/metabolite transporter (DMT)-like permease
MRQLQLKGHISTLGAVILFGLMSPMCKLAMQSGVIDGLLLAFFRVSGAALLFWLISPLVKREKIARKDWLPLLGMSLCGMVISQFLYVLGIQYTSPTNASVVGTTTPVMTFILASIFLQHRVTWLRISGFLLASIGALVLILGSGGGLSGNPLGDMLCFVSQFSAACYFVFFGGVFAKPVRLAIPPLSRKLYLPFYIHRYRFLKTTQTDSRRMVYYENCKHCCVYFSNRRRGELGVVRTF